MARDRARSSFTVEVRRGRSTPVETDPKRALWRGHDLAGESARHEAITRAAEPAPVASQATSDLFAARAPVVLRETPRVLPSLLAGPALIEEPALPPERDEPLPRVRRARRPRAERPTEAPLAGPDPDEVFDEAPEAIFAPVPATEDQAEPLRLRRRAPRDERVLRAGERWKRRLPRALW